MKTTAPLLRVTLPSDILLPADADFNALFRVLSKAQPLDTVMSSTDPAHEAHKYAGPTTYFVRPNRLPEIKPFSDDLHFSEEAAQAAHNEATGRVLAERA